MVNEYLFENAFLPKKKKKAIKEVEDHFFISIVN
jgi:hypothetical protein